MISIVHIADTHLDTPFRELPAKVASARRQAIRTALYEALREAGERGVNVVLMAGDMFDNGEATGESVRLFVEMAQQYPKTEFFIAPGNHDCLYGSSPYRNLLRPENLHIFGTGRIERIDFDEYTVYGVGCLYERSEEQLLSGFRVADPTRINIMCMHSQVQGFGGHAVYQPITLDQIANSGLDYLALGHVHTYSGICQSGNTYYAYPGTLVGRGFDETGAKGYLKGTVDKGKVELDFIESTVGRFETVEIDVAGVQSMTELVARVRGCLASISAEWLVKLVLVGSRPAHLMINLAALSQEGKHLQFCKIIDKTRLERNIEQLMKENTLTGLFLRELAKESVDEELRNQAISLGLAALAGEELMGFED